MAKRLVIDYGTDTLIDLDAPRQNLEQRFNLGGLARQKYGAAGLVEEIAKLQTRPVGKTGQVISDVKTLGRGAEWPDLSGQISSKTFPLKESPEQLLEILISTKGNLLNPNWWSGLKQYQLMTGKKFKEIKKDLGYHGDSKTLNDAVKKLNLADTFDFKVGGKFGTFADLPFGNTSMTEITKKGGRGLDDTYTRIEKLEIDPAKTMVNETDLKKILGLEQKSGLADNHYQGVKTEGAGQNKKVLLGDVLNNIKKTIERKAALADPGRINKIRKETSKAVEGLMGDISKSFLGLKEPVTLGKAIKAEHIPSRIKNIFKKYELGDIELAHKFPLHFFGQGKHTPKIKWIREHKDLLVKPDTYSWQSKDVNQGILKTAQNKLVKPYKALQPYFDKYKAGDKISKKDAGAITEINNKIIKTKKGIDDQVTEFLKARPKDVSGRMFQNQGGIDVAIFDLATAQPKLLNEGKSLWGKSAEDMTPEELLYMKTNLKQDWANIASKKISAPHDKKTFETFVMSDWFSPSKVGTESRYKSSPRAYAHGGAVVPRIGYRVGTSYNVPQRESRQELEMLKKLEKWEAEAAEGWTPKSTIDRIGDAIAPQNWGSTIPYYGSMANRGIVNALEFTSRLPKVIKELAVGGHFTDLYRNVEGLIDEQTGVDEKNRFSRAWDEISRPYEMYQDVPMWFNKKGVITLGDIIKDQEAMMKAKGFSSAPQIIGKNIELGTDLLMPIVPVKGMKLMGRGSNKINKVLGEAPTGEKVQKMNQMIDDHLNISGQSRRDFNIMVGSMGLLAAMKSVGLDKVFKITPEAKVAGSIKVLKGTSSKMPEWFPLFINKIEPKLMYEGDGMSSFSGTDDFLPGIQVEKNGNDYLITGKNEYDQTWTVSYEGPKWLEVEPGQKPVYFRGEFEVMDEAPYMVGPEDYDWDLVTHNEVGDILGGNGRSMEEFAKGTKTEGLTSGEKQVDWAEGRFQSEMDMAKEEGLDDY